MNWYSIIRFDRLSFAFIQLLSIGLSVSNIVLSGVSKTYGKCQAPVVYRLLQGGLVLATSGINVFFLITSCMAKNKLDEKRSEIKNQVEELSFFLGPVTAHQELKIIVWSKHYHDASIGFRFLTLGGDASTMLEGARSFTRYCVMGEQINLWGILSSAWRTTTSGVATVLSYFAQSPERIGENIGRLFGASAAIAQGRVYEWLDTGPGATNKVAALEGLERYLKGALTHDGEKFIILYNRVMFEIKIRIEAIPPDQLSAAANAAAASEITTEFGIAVAIPTAETPTSKILRNCQDISRVLISVKQKVESTHPELLPQLLAEDAILLDHDTPEGKFQSLGIPTEEIDSLVTVRDAMLRDELVELLQGSEGERLDKNLRHFSVILRDILQHQDRSYVLRHNKLMVRTADLAESPVKEGIIGVLSEIRGNIVGSPDLQMQLRQEGDVIPDLSTYEGRLAIEGYPILEARGIAEDAMQQGIEQGRAEGATIRAEQAARIAEDAARIAVLEAALTRGGALDPEHPLQDLEAGGELHLGHDDVDHHV